MSKNPKGALSNNPQKIKLISELGPELQAAWKQKDWPHWKKPRDPLPIDDEISRMIGLTEKRGGLLPRDLLKTKGVVCPYKTARNAVIMAAMFAKFEPVREAIIKAENKRSSEFEKDATTIADKLSELIKNASSISFAPSRERGSGRANIEDVNDALSKAAPALRIVTNAISALNTLAEQAKTERDRLPTKSELSKAQEAAFADYLGYLWVKLTGENINSATQNFVSFVTAASDSLGGEDKKWDGQVRNAIERANKRPWWDRFDKYEKGYLRPGETRMTPDEHENMNKRRKDQQETNLQRLTRVAASNGHPAQAFAQNILDRSSEPDHAGRLASFIDFLDYCHAMTKAR